MSAIVLQVAGGGRVELSWSGSKTFGRQELDPLAKNPAEIAEVQFTLVSRALVIVIYDGEKTPDSQKLSLSGLRLDEKKVVQGYLHKGTTLSFGGVPKCTVESIKW